MPTVEFLWARGGAVAQVQDGGESPRFESSHSRLVIRCEEEPKDPLLLIAAQYVASKDPQDVFQAEKHRGDVPLPVLTG